MEEIIQNVPTQYIIYTVIVLCAVVVFCIKAAPSVIKAFNSMRFKVNHLESLEKAIEKNTSNIELINQKIGRDFARLNATEKAIERQEKYTLDSLEERELILRSLLGVIQGLQEIGANGPTKKAEAEIQAYLLRRSHDIDRSSHETY